MANNKRPPRFSLSYLAIRHAGMVFALAALGVLLGVGIRVLYLPTAYQAHAEYNAARRPAGENLPFDWDGKAAAWRNLLRENDHQDLLTYNLRHAYKLALTQSEKLGTETLDSHLENLGRGLDVSVLLLPFPWLGSFTPHIQVTRRSLVENLDPQSLAAIAADLDPPTGSAGWDFSFYSHTPRQDPDDILIVQPGPEDRHFRVFYHLYGLLNDGRPPASPSEAWHAATEVVAERLERESQQPGGGGFGHTAKRELIREIVATPALAANGLYRTSGWSGDNHLSAVVDNLWAGRWANLAELRFDPRQKDSALLRLGMGFDLKPILFPRDTSLTRIAPLAVSVLGSYLSAREKLISATQRPAEPREAAPTAKIPPPSPPPPPAPPAAAPRPPPEPVYCEAIDDLANNSRLAHINMLENSIKMAVADRDASLRRYEANRETQNRLAYEALNARDRADRLAERYEEALKAADAVAAPQVPPEAAELFARRDGIFRHLMLLLETCTEEHPFVRDARRELATLEAVLKDLTPDEQANKKAEERATRLANLYLEWEAASAAADSLDERSQRQDNAVQCLLDETVNMERCLSQREIELDEARKVPVPMKRILVAPAPEKPAPAVAAAPAAPVLRVEAPVTVPVETPWLDIAPTGRSIAEVRIPPSWRPVWWGFLAGLALGLLAMIWREIFARRFRNANEARHMLRLPVLAALPAFDLKTQKKAAATMKGELVKDRLGCYHFTPAPIETDEPAPEARRGKISPAAARWRWGRWFLGGLFLLLAFLLWYKWYISPDGLIRPPPPRTLDMSRSGAAEPAWNDETEAWKDQP